VEVWGEEKQSAKRRLEGSGPGERGAANRAGWAAVTGASGLRHREIREVFLRRK